MQEQVFNDNMLFYWQDLHNNEEKHEVHAC